MLKSTYRLRPTVPVNVSAEQQKGYAALVELLDGFCAIETYPGFDTETLVKGLRDHGYDGRIALAEDFCPLGAKAFRNKISEDLTEDRVFGRFTNKNYSEYYDHKAVEDFVSQHEGKVLVVGVCASLFVKKGARLLYADMTRWQLQLLYRKNTPVFFKGGIEADALSNFKRGYFVE